jgi:hypothetical protein
MKKKQFKPNTVLRHLERDYPLGQDITLEFWKDPSRSAIMDLLRIISRSTREDGVEMTDEERDRINARYFECASLIIRDCDIEGVDFSTPAAAEKSFDMDTLPWGIFHEAMLLYVDELMEKNERLKNALRRVGAASRKREEESNSGTESEKLESPSATE